MPLVIEVLSYEGRSPLNPMSATFDRDGGALGRLPANQLILPDPSRNVSRRHALVSHENGNYYLTDTSMNGTFLSNRGILLQGEKVELFDGDKLRIGDYELSVSIHFNAKTEKRSSRVTPQNISALEAKSELACSADMNSGILDLNDPTRTDLQLDECVFIPPCKPFDEVYKADVQLPEAPFLGSRSVVPCKPPLDVPVAFDFEELFDVKIKLEEYQRPRGSSHNNGAAAAGDISRAEANVETGGQAITRNACYPHDSGMATESEVPAVPGETVSSHPDGAEPPYAGGQHSRESTRELFDIFMKCAGISDPSSVPTDVIPELMRNAGAVFREMVNGLMAILRARMESKSEIRLSVTLLGPSNNNPLKFSPSVDEAVELLLIKRSPGYLGPLEAVRKGHEDIMKHQLAMEVGIKAALLELLKKFEPRNFSQKYEEGIVVRRRSKCWDAYCTAYDKLAGEALDGLFGDAFVRAYEEHLGRLDGDRAEGRHSRGHGSGE